MDLNVARSRTNIAALHHLGHHAPRRTQVTRALSFYHPGTPAVFSPPPPPEGGGGSGGTRVSTLPRPPAKDVSQPLHVDCSIEYDLGAQPKIPKDSAPLLIIHPDYTKKQKQDALAQQQVPDRYHPYVGLPPPARGATGAPGVNRTPQNAPSRHQSLAARSEPHPTRVPGTKIARHQSFLIPGTAYGVHGTQYQPQARLIFVHPLPTMCLLLSSP